MCLVEEVISCQISFNPINSRDYLGEIEKVLHIIRSYDVEYSIGILSTSMVGDKEKIFTLIRELYESMKKVCGFSMDIKISNICGYDFPGSPERC